MVVQANLEPRLLFPGKEEGDRTVEAAEEERNSWDLEFRCGRRFRRGSPPQARGGIAKDLDPAARVPEGSIS